MTEEQQLSDDLEEVAAMSITEKLHALGMHDLSTELMQERMAWLHQIAAANTLRDELLAALERIKHVASLGFHHEDEKDLLTVVREARAAITKAKGG